jgi:hypothetical protein
MVPRLFSLEWHFMRSARESRIPIEGNFMGMRYGFPMGKLAWEFWR